MKEYKQQKKAFLQALQESRTYTVYLEKKKALDKEPEKKRLVNDLRKRNYAFRSSQYTENYDQVLEELAAEMEVLREDRVIDEFFAAELALCRMIQGLMNEIYASIDMDMDFL